MGESVAVRNVLVVWPRVGGHRGPRHAPSPADWQRGFFHEDRTV